MALSRKSGKYEKTKFKNKGQITTYKKYHTILYGDRMKIYEKLLQKSPMTRPDEKIEKVEKVVLHGLDSPCITALSYRNYLDSLSKQSTTYSSVHYIIGLDGEIICCIPEVEVAWHAGNLQMNYKSLGIQLCHIAENGRPNKKTRDSLVYLLSYLCQRYQLDPKQDLLLHAQIADEICPRYYVEHEEEWEAIQLQVEQYIKQEES